MNHLVIEDLLQIHVLLIQKYGGSEGVRDLGRLHAAIAVQTQEVFGVELYETVHEKAAAMIRGIIADHPFYDGNKRTGILAGLTLIEMGGMKVVAKQGEIEDFAVSVATDHLDVANIAVWLRGRTQRQ